MGASAPLFMGDNMGHFKREYDPETLQVSDYYWDEDTGTMRVKRSWNLDTAVTELNKRMANDSIGFTYINNPHAFHRIANIDNVTITRLLREHNIDVFNLSDPENRKRFLRWLEDPENRAWKCTTKKVYIPR